MTPARDLALNLPETLNPVEVEFDFNFFKEDKEEAEKLHRELEEIRIWIENSSGSNLVVR
ncbi:MAG: hypothetical protein V1794_06085 [Candidatus Glassbacteria bacterium]